MLRDSKQPNLKEYGKNSLVLQKRKARLPAGLTSYLQACGSVLPAITGGLLEVYHGRSAQ